MLEIYNEQVRDLLVSAKNKQQAKGNLKVRLHPKMGFYVEGLKVGEFKYCSLILFWAHFLLSLSVATFVWNSLSDIIG